MVDGGGAAVTSSIIDTDPSVGLKPRRLLGVWQPSAVVVGMVVGAGIFRTSSLAAQTLPDTEGQPPEADGPGQGLVLVVDDDPATRELVARFLERDGFRVAVAADGWEGMEKARALKPRVVLLDVTMPQMDGWSVLRALRGDAELGSTPVVIVTVLNERNLAFSLGATDYLQKPVDWDELHGVMNRFRPQAPAESRPIPAEEATSQA